MIQEEPAKKNHGFSSSWFTDYVFTFFRTMVIYQSQIFE
jgi:hypothetical protein